MKKIILIIITVIVVLVVVIFGGLQLLFKDSEKFVCKSNEGSITIYYKNDKIDGYTAVRYSYDLKEHQKRAKEIGMEEYLEEFNKWFVSNSTNGKCEKK